MKKLLSIVLAMTMLISTMCITGFAASDAWDGTVDYSWFDASDVQSAYTIDSAAELAGLAYLVNNKIGFYEENYASQTNNVTITLATDIDLGGKAWTPIGKADARFTGIFDGGGCVVSNLNAEAADAGLFGAAGCGWGDGSATATIKNLTVENAKVSGTSTAAAIVGNAYVHVTLDKLAAIGDLTITSDWCAGGITAYGYTDITNSKVEANAGSTIDAYEHAGGICGLLGEGSSSTISACATSGVEVTAETYGAGGICGFSFADSTVTECEVADVVVDSLAGADKVGYVSGGVLGANSTANTASNVTTQTNGQATEAKDAGTVIIPVAKIGNTPYATVQAAINAAEIGDVVTLMPGQFSSINLGGKTLTLEGSVGADGELLSEIVGGNPALTLHNFNGTIRNLKVTDAFKTTYGEPAGNITFDNLYVTGGTYGLHLVAYESDVIWNIQNCYMDISWANSLGVAYGAEPTINITGNTFKSTNPLYADYGAPVVNSFSPNTTISENAFGENAKIYLRTEDVAENATIGTNYYAAGPENAFIEDTDSYETSIPNYYETPEMNPDEVGQAPVKMGDDYFYSIGAAVAKATPGATIEVLPGTYEAFDVPKDKDGLTIKGVAGNTRAISKPVISITDVNDGGVEYHAANLTFENLMFVVEDTCAAPTTWNVSALGYYYEIVEDRNGLTIKDCDFVNNSDIDMSAIAANISKYTITGTSFKNFTTGVHSMMDGGAVDELNVTNNTFANVETLVSAYYGAAADGSANITVTGNRTTDGSQTQISIDDYARVNDINRTAYNNITVTDNDALVLLHNSTDAFTTVLNNNQDVVYTYRTEEILTSLLGNIPEGTVYVQYGTVNEQKFEVTGNAIVTAEEIELVFVENTSVQGALDNSVWDLVLKANDTETINRLNSADFTFVIDNANIDYELVATNNEIAINPVANSTNRYEFHFKNKDNVQTDTAQEIIIGQVRFTGYGVYEFKVDTAVDTNVVHTTTLNDNLVNSYVVGDGTLIVNVKDAANPDTDGVIDSAIEVATKDLTINIDFNNAVAKNAVDYQNMSVVVSGGDLKAPIEIALDNNDQAVALGANHVVDKSNAAYAVNAGVDNKYIVTLTAALTENVAYNVTVSGAGYRTARYTVTMTDDKTLNFWNNVMDVAQVVETGKAASAATLNFLAGDILEDNKINIYDLSAVVSYFGETGTAANGYAQYDLNRDTKIDSKDVAYVLVSWNN